MDNIRDFLNKLYSLEHDTYAISEGGAKELKKYVELKHLDIAQTIQYVFNNGFKCGIREVINTFLAEMDKYKKSSNQEVVTQPLNKSYAFNIDMEKQNETGIKNRKAYYAKRCSANYNSVEVGEGFEADETVTFEEFQALRDAMKERVDKEAETERQTMQGVAKDQTKLPKPSKKDILGDIKPK